MIRLALLVYMIFSVLTLLTGQVIYFSNHEGKLFTVDMENGNCDVEELLTITYGGSSHPMSDIAFHPSGNMYGTDGLSYYEINPQNGVAIKLGDLPYLGTGTTSLVSDENGTLYAAGSILLEIDPVNVNVTNLGQLPYNSAGDLAFNNGHLYLACRGNILLKVNIDDPSASQVVGQMNIRDEVFGIVTFASNCTDIQTFGSSGDDFYLIDVNTALSMLVCDLSNVGLIFGATAETDYVASDCLLFVDLDGDNSSGSLGIDFTSNEFCGDEEVPIADEDVHVTAEGVKIDSMIVWIGAGLYDGAYEVLKLEDSGDFVSVGSSTSKIKLINPSNLLPVDLESILKKIRYKNTKLNYTPGIREIHVKIFGGEDSKSKTAIAYLELTDLINASLDLGNDTSLCSGNVLLLDAYIDQGISYTWNDNSMNPINEITETGIYSVTVSFNHLCLKDLSDTISVEFIEPLENLDLGENILLCEEEMVDLNAQLIDGDDYIWNTGSNQPVLSVTEPGTYSVTVSTTCGLQIDQVQIDYQQIPQYSIFPNDTLICNNDELILNAQFEDALSYRWNDGFSGPMIGVSTSGLYAVTVNFHCGDYYDSTFVSYDDQELLINLGQDTTLCYGDVLILDAYSPNAELYQWHDGNENNTYEAQESAVYQVTVSNSCREVSDEVKITLKSCCNIYVPNIFSPISQNSENKDFGLYSDCIFPKYEMNIFDRWGNKVYHSKDQEDRWNGSYKGDYIQSGVYVYQIEFHDGLEDRVLAGDVSLVR